MKIFYNYLCVNVYEFILTKFQEYFGNIDLIAITTDNILSFLNDTTRGTKKSTRRLRFSLLSSFFNFIRNSINQEFHNPCDNPILRKLFKDPKPNNWEILDKEIVDEIILRTENPRNRLILELIARGGMRIGEVLKLQPKHIDDRKIILKDVKSGKETEIVFIPNKVASRLKNYIDKQGIQREQKIFPIGYAAARIVVKNAGLLVGIKLRPHDLLRHAATYASRAGTALEVVSKIILRHANLVTTQRYLGKITSNK